MQYHINDFLPKLNNLTADTKALWGKMTAQHMVEHLILAVKMSNGKVRLECFNPPEKLPTLKRILLSSRPLPRNFINPYLGEDLMPLEYKSLEEAKQILAEEIKDYYKYFEDNPDTFLTNVTFGDLNKDEWEVFHQKHFIHHFKQFGLLEENK